MSLKNAIKVEKLTPIIGAEVSGIDLSRPLTAEEFEAVEQALLDNLVIFFRDQNLTPEQQLEFGRRFGPLHAHPAATKATLSKGKETRQAYPHPEYPEILVIQANEASKRAAGENWHSDVSCDPEPPLGSILYNTVVPAVGGDTLFMSMYAAYEALSEPMKKFVEGLTAIHDGERIYRARFNNDPTQTYPRSEHPVVRTHPRTGRKALFVNREFTASIPQLSPRESEAVLQLLYAHCEDERFQCRFRWQETSIAFWDNRCTQHRAMWDYYPESRYGHRVSIKGDRPFFAQS